MTLEISNEEFQVCSSFPNDNSKCIDFVLFYEENLFQQNENVVEENRIRSEFFTQLKIEKIDSYDLEFERDEKYKKVIKLLHCSLDRLFREAEKIKLEMPLKKNTLCGLKEANEEELDSSKSFMNKIKALIFEDKVEASLSTRFDNGLKFLFECDNQKEPFSSSRRGLLIESILNNIEFRNIKLSKKIKLIKMAKNETDIDDNETADSNNNEDIGLQFMLHNNILKDAFVIHDLTSYVSANRKYENIQNIFDEENEEVYYNKIVHLKQKDKEDMRENLNNHWAKMRRIFSYQPINNIRLYFGEKMGLYFAWTGMLVSTLWLPSIVGLIFFIVGLERSVVKNDFANSTKNLTLLDKVETNFVDSFDTELTPYFAVIICIWGTLFIECFKRRNAELAFKWNVMSFEKHESDLPAYVKRKEELKVLLKNCSALKKYIYSVEKKIKIFISCLILLFMICISIMQLSAVILYRIHLNITYINNPVTALLLGNVMSTVITTVFVTIMNLIYQKVCRVTTIWENHRTVSQFEDNIIIKNFAFQFINSYSPLFYLAFFRLIDYPNGIFGLGPKYQDKCKNDDCMSLLSLQIIIMLLTKPLSSFLLTVIIPILVSIFQLIIKQIKYRNNEVVSPAKIDLNSSENLVGKKSSSYLAKLNEKCVKAYVLSEKNKSSSEDTIHEEYVTKVLIFGGLVLFGASMSIGPLIFLLVNLIDIRLDAKRLLWLYKRPVGYRAQDIGTWNVICNFLNIIGIVTNGLILSFTSKWSKTALNDNRSERLTFFIIFEHALFFVWFLIKFLIPDMSSEVKQQIRSNRKNLNELMSLAKRQESGIPYSNNSFIHLNGLTAPNSIVNIRDTASTVQLKENQNLAVSETTLNSDENISTTESNYLKMSLTDKYSARRRHLNETQINNLKKAGKASKKYLRLQRKLYPVVDIKTSEEADT